MTGRLLVSANDPAKIFGKTIMAGKYQMSGIFRKEHPPSRFLAEVGLELMSIAANEHETVVIVNERAIDLDSFRAFAYKVVAHAYRQLITESQSSRWMKRYHGLSTYFAELAAGYDCDEGRGAKVFLETLLAAKHPGTFSLERVLGSIEGNLAFQQMPSRLEIAHAAIVADRFAESRKILETLDGQIPHEHRPAIARYARLRLAAELGLNRKDPKLLKHARDACQDFPHDARMLEEIVRRRGHVQGLFYPR